MHLRSALPFVFLACSSTPTTAQAPTVRFVTSAAVPAFMDVPFPSDAYLVNGHVGAIPGMDQIIPENSSMLLHALAVHDGFSRSAYTAFYVDDPSAPPADDGSVAAALIDTTTLPLDETKCGSPESSVLLVDLDAGKLVPCRAAYHVAPLGHTRPVLGIAPARGVVLAPGGHYAAAITSRVKDKNGKALAASPDFTKIATGDRSAAVGALYGAALDKVNGIAPGAGVVGLAVFTTNKMEEELYGLRDQLEDAPAPALAWDATSMAPMGATKFTSKTPLPTGFTASLDDWLGVPTAPKLPDGTDDPDRTLPVRAHDAIDTIGTAVFDAINYLSVRPNGYSDPEHANFARDASGKIIPAPEKPTSKIWVTFFTPKTAMPAGGYPIVIVQHGLSSSREYGFDLANTFCKNGWMVAAIDSATFGARAPEAQFQVDQHSIWASAPGAKYDGPDGQGDQVNGSFNGPADAFGNLLNIGAFRDQLRQAEFDTTQLAKVLRSSPDLSPLQTGTSAPKIDPAHVAYIGDSFGGIEGAVAAAIEPHARRVDAQRRRRRHHRRRRGASARHLALPLERRAQLRLRGRSDHGLAPPRDAHPDDRRPGRPALVREPPRHLAAHAEGRSDQAAQHPPDRGHLRRARDERRRRSARARCGLRARVAERRLERRAPGSRSPGSKPPRAPAPERLGRRERNPRHARTGDYRGRRPGWPRDAWLRSRPLDGNPFLQGSMGAVRHALAFSEARHNLSGAMSVSRAAGHDDRVLRFGVRGANPHGAGLQTSGARPRRRWHA